jgi:AhpC/TSA family
MRWTATALAVFLAAAACAADDPFASAARARVLIFVRTDCPITNRYAPELQRLSQEFGSRGAAFWLVYPDPAETAVSIERHRAAYNFPGTVLRDPRHSLVKLAHATTAPEAAVFDAGGKLLYHGRIDDRWVNPGTVRPSAHTHDLEDAISAVLSGRRPAPAATPAVGCSLADVE